MNHSRIALLMLASLMIAADSQAASSSGFPWNWATAKAQTKEATKWSLSEWLAAKNQSKLMDMWLVMHSPTPYEFYLGAEYRSASQGSGSGQNSGARYSMGMFAHAFGLTGERDALEDRWEARFNARLFGYQHQGTHWIVAAGIRSDGSPRSSDPLIYTELDLYLAKAFGIETSYRHDFVRTSDRWTIGAHLDFAFVRIHGEWYRLDSDWAQDLSGWSAGLRLYF